MRIHKFKAYIENKNCIVDVESINLLDNSPYIISGGNKYSLTEVYLLEYIGIEDIQGFELYSGDIVKSGDHIGMIEYREELCSFCLRSYDGTIECIHDFVYPNNKLQLIKNSHIKD